MLDLVHIKGKSSRGLHDTRRNKLVLKKFLSIIGALLVILSFSASTSAAGSKGDEIATVAKKYLGVPYKWGGSSPSGFDCSGFMIFIYKQFGVSLPHSSAAQYNLGTPVAKADLEPGDMVFFKNTYKAGISHAGIYIGNNKFVSAVDQGIAIDLINDPYYWGAKYAGAKRIVKSEPKPEAAMLAALPAGQYHDVPVGFWAYKEITDLSKAGIINGYEGSLFKPDNTMTRAEAAKILSEALGLTPKSSRSFNDVADNHWAKGFIGAVVNAGIMKGTSETSFAPNDKLTRAQIAALLARAFELKTNSTETNLIDIEQHWAYEDILKVTSNGIADGFTDNTYRPNTYITRGEFCVFLYRSIK